MLVGSQVLERSLARENGQVTHVPREEGDVRLEEGKDERTERKVRHLLQHLVEVRHRDCAGLEHGRLIKKKR